MNDQTPRWYYRFDNYRRAFTLLREAIEQESPLTQLEKEGVIQRFEYTMELAWKMLKDYLESEGVVFDQITPRAVIRRAFEAGVITQGDVWQKALDARNRMSHTYNFATFEQVIADIHASYLAVFDELYEFLLAQRVEVYSAPKEFELSGLGAHR
jgi:nucleotidyltransferase substrate binding protein (TIGR01987 family)